MGGGDWGVGGRVITCHQDFVPKRHSFHLLSLNRELGLRPFSSVVVPYVNFRGLPDRSRRVWWFPTREDGNVTVGGAPQEFPPDREPVFVDVAFTHPPSQQHARSVHLAKRKGARMRMLLCLCLCLRLCECTCRYVGCVKR
jgi:hypothetical protein